MMVLKQQTMVRIQKIQRQPRYWTMIPPNRGPKVGPRRGPRRYQPKTPLRRVRDLSVVGHGYDRVDLRSLTRMEHIADSTTAVCNTHTCRQVNQLKILISKYLISFSPSGQGLMDEYILPKKPLIVLTAIKVPKFGLKAVGICNIAKVEKQYKYSFRRPKVSESGANTRGPNPKKTTKPVVAPTTTSADVPRSLAISPIPGVNMLEAKGERTMMNRNQ